jgi:hypothetical protein
MFVVIGIATALPLGWLGTSHYQSQTTADEVVASHTADNTDEAARRRVKLLEARVMALESTPRNVSAVDGATTAAHVTESDEPTAESAHGSDPLGLPSPEEQRQADEAYQTELEMTIAHEPVDNGWANEREGELTMALTEQAFAGSRLVDVSCHTSLCKIEVEHDGEDELMSFPEKLMSSDGVGRTGGAWGIESEVDGRWQTVVYVARDGHEYTLDRAQAG